MISTHSRSSEIPLIYICHEILYEVLCAVMYQSTVATRKFRTATLTRCLVLRVYTNSLVSLVIQSTTLTDHLQQASTRRSRSRLRRMRTTIQSAGINPRGSHHLASIEAWMLSTDTQRRGRAICQNRKSRSWSRLLGERLLSIIAGILPSD